MKRYSRNFVLAVLLVFSAGAVGVGTRALAADSSAQETYLTQIRALPWLRGPAKATIAGNSTLVIPDGYAFLDTASTQKYLELNKNLGNGKEVMIAPTDLSWEAYLEFDDAGYVKDDEKIDAAALLKTLKEGTEQSNEERQRRGWHPIHVVDWAIPPAYNNATRRLEWATILASENHQSANFFTKILGRRGYTSVELVARPEDLPTAQQGLNGILTGYTFNSGEGYAEWRPGDKVAEYGLAALIVGGVAAVATKKGFWAVAAGFLATAWKAIVAALVAGGAWFRKLLSKKKD